MGNGQTSTQAKKSARTLKQVAFAIGTKREQKLDELVFDYNRKNNTRIGRNDVVRYVLDTITLADLEDVNLTEYKK